MFMVVFFCNQTNFIVYQYIYIQIEFECVSICKGATTHHDDFCFWQNLTSLTVFVFDCKSFVSIKLTRSIIFYACPVVNVILTCFSFYKPKYCNQANTIC